MSTIPASIAEPLLRGRLHAAPAGTPQERHRLTAGLARALPFLLGAAALGSLLLVIDPRQVARAMGRFDLWLAIPLAGLGAGYYLLQGLRWHLLLRAIGAKQRVADSELVNLAGQSVTAVLPLGDLTRALLVSASTGVEFGAAAATVTVQELTFTLLLVLAAVPGLGRLPGGLSWVVAVVTGITGIVIILTVPRVFAVTRRAVGATPGVRHLSGQIDTLQREVGKLLRRPDVLGGSVLDLGRVVVVVSATLLILHGLGVTSLGWRETALVVAIAYVGGALSLLPGGVGANEASVVGILVVLGVNPAAAAAAALLQRLWLSGFATVGGLPAYAVVHHRLRLTGLGGVSRLAATEAAGDPASAAPRGEELRLAA
jgi:uncharacterized protein (TIRG00374 family)